MDQQESRTVRFLSPQGHFLSGTLHGHLGQVAVVSCHGMFSCQHGQKHLYLAQALAKRQIPMLRFDCSGVGSSQGRFYDLSYSQRMQDLQGAMDFLFSQGVAQIALFGSSMGGAVALLAAAREPRVVAVATLSAIGQPEGLLDANPDAYTAWAQEGVVQTPLGPVGPGFLQDSRARDVPSAVGVLQIPLLVVHGEEDTVVPISDAHDIAVAARNVRLEIVSGADHSFTRPEHLRPSMNLIATFLTDVLQAYTLHRLG